MCLTFIRGYLFGKIDPWAVYPSDPRSWYPNKWTLLMQLIQPLRNWLEQPFTRMHFWLRSYRFRIFLTCVCAGIPLTLVFGKYMKNWLRQEINEKRVIQVIGKMIKNPINDCKNPVIAKDTTGHYPSAWKVRSKWFFLVFRSLIALIQVSKQIDPLCPLYEL